MSDGDDHGHDDHQGGEQNRRGSSGRGPLGHARPGVRLPVAALCLLPGRGFSSGAAHGHNLTENRQGADATFNR